MRGITLPYLFLFFCFFISFAVINFPSAEWGLQMSWAIALIMLLFFPIYIGFKFKLPINHNFKIITGFFVTVIICAIISIILQDLGIIKFDNLTFNELKSRSIPHCIYLVFEFIIYLFLIIYLNKQPNQTNAIRWFIEYPFYLIALYGIYQWLTTFDIVPYTEFFNNSKSTGFTYLRFKAAHRSCSIFPEPSEYAYYLGFMLPFFMTPFYNKSKEKAPIFFKKYKLALSLYVFAIFSTGSMSLFAVLPIIFYIVARKFIKLSPKIYAYVIGLCILLVIIIFALQGSRINEMSSGDDGSAITRFAAFEETIELFIGSPIIGGGFGAVRGLDLLSFLMGTTGLIGTIYFIVMIFKIRIYTYTNNIFKTGLICMVIVALLSNPIIDDTFFWPILAFNTVPLNYISE